MRKTIFIPDRWVKFTHLGATCIGISYLRIEADIDDPKSHLIQFISNERKTNVVNFHKCEDLTSNQLYMN